MMSRKKNNPIYPLLSTWKEPEVLYEFLFFTTSNKVIWPRKKLVQPSISAHRKLPKMVVSAFTNHV
jgi:hypothetical protein